MFRSYKLLYYVIPLSFLLGIAWGLKKLESRRSTPAPITKQVSILGKKGMLPPEIVLDFERSKGVKVQYFEAQTDSELLQMALEKTADIIISPSYLFPQLIRSKRLKYLDKANLINWPLISGDFLNLPYDPENAYSFPIAWDLHGYLYKKDKVQVEGFSLTRAMNNKKYQNHVSVLGDPVELYAQMLSQKLILDEWIDHQQEELVDKALKTYLSSLHFTEDDLSEFILKDQHWIIQAPLGEAYSFINENGDWSYAYPEEKSSLQTTSLGISEKPMDEDAVYAFLNHISSTQVAHKYAHYTKTPTTLKDLNELPKWLRAEFIRTVELNHYRLLTAQRSLDPLWLRSVDKHAPNLLEPKRTMNQ